MTTRVTVLGTDAQTPGVWTGPQSMVQPSPLLGDEGGAGMLANATSQAIPDTLALRDTSAGFAVKGLGFVGSPAFPSPDASFVQTYYDQTTRLFGIETVAGKFIVSGSAASEGASRLDIGGDSAVADELSLWASAADLDGPRLAMGYTSGAVSLFTSSFGLSDLTGSNSIGFSVGAAERLDVSSSLFLNVPTGEEIELRVNNVKQVEVLGTGTNILSPNQFNIFQVQDAGISLSHAFGFVDITGGGSPGVTLNTADLLSVSAVNSALLRRSEDGLVREREFVFPPVATTNATVTSVLEFTTATGFIYRVWAELWCADDTNNTGGAFAPRMAAFLNVGAGAVQIEATRIIGPAGSIADDCLGAALRAGPVAITIDASGSIIRVRVTGVAATNITWLGLVKIQPVAVV